MTPAPNAVRSEFAGLGLEPLLTLPTVPAQEFQDWGGDSVASSPKNAPTGPFASEKEFRFCKAVAEHPLLASSEYPKLAGMSSKTAGPIRDELISSGLVQQHVVNAAKRGPSTLLLEATPAGKAAIEEYEARPEGATP